MVTKQRLSIAEYLALPEHEKPYLEYIAGEAVAKALPNEEHSALVPRFIEVIHRYCEAHGGKVGSEGRAEFEDPADPRFLLPDVAYYRAGQRLKARRAMTPPTLAVEVRSPEETMAKQRDKCRYYVSHGVEVAWLVDPRSRSIEVYGEGEDGIARTSGTLTTAALPGFSLDIVELFAGIDAEIA